MGDVEAADDAEPAIDAKMVLVYSSCSIETGTALLACAPPVAKTRALPVVSIGSQRLTTHHPAITILEIAVSGSVQISARGKPPRQREPRSFLVNGFSLLRM